MPAVHRHSIVHSQNFLRSHRHVQQLVDRSSIGPDDLVIEIGPGRGVITSALATHCRQVIAVEKDSVLAAHLCGRFSRTVNVAVFEADFLFFPLPVTPYKVFASIPFSITTAILTKLTSSPTSPDDAYLAMQREAAARFLGEPRESLTAVLLKPWFEPTLVHHFRRTDFAPVPQVDVVMLRLRKRGPPLVGAEDAQVFRDFVVFAFTAWKPTLRLALAGVLSKSALARIERQPEIELDLPPATTPFDVRLQVFAAFRSLADDRALLAFKGAEERLRHQQSGLEKRHRTRAGRR
jgi:23S rRNA (adenine-N6)-dimethyltransferase